MFTQLRKHIVSVKYHYFFLLSILMVFVYIIYKTNYVKRNGVFTVCRYIKTEYEGDGSSNYIEIHFKGKIINDILGDIKDGVEGKYYFIKINKDNPKRYGFFTNIEVPQCIVDSLETKLPSEGWKEIPKDICK